MLLGRRLLPPSRQNLLMRLAGGGLWFCLTAGMLQSEPAVLVVLARVLRRLTVLLLVARHWRLFGVGGGLLTWWHLFNFSNIKMSLAVVSK